MSPSYWGIRERTICHCPTCWKDTHTSHSYEPNGVTSAVSGEGGRCDLAQAFGFSLFSNCQSTSSSLLPLTEGRWEMGRHSTVFEWRIWKKVENISQSRNVNRTSLCRGLRAGVPELPLGRVSWPQMAPAMSLVFATPPREEGSFPFPLNLQGTS